jgi:hypothetical protein
MSMTKSLEAAREQRMVREILVVIVLCASAAWGKEIDWKPCTDFTDQFKAQVNKWNSEHKDGFVVELSCMFSGDPKREKFPKREVALNRQEITRLHALRAVSRAAFEAEDSYENYLFVAHHEHKPKIGEPCYYFAGIIVDTDYITVDPNPMDPELLPADCPKVTQ